jgi:hypothetical protein
MHRFHAQGVWRVSVEDVRCRVKNGPRAETLVPGGLPHHNPRRDDRKTKKQGGRHGGDLER